jgi:hypothetical protein
MILLKIFAWGGAFVLVFLVLMMTSVRKRKYHVAYE